MNTPLKLDIATFVLGSFAAATFGAGEHPVCRRGGGFELSVNRTNKADRLESVVAKSTPASAPRSIQHVVGPTADRMRSGIQPSR